MKLSLRTAAALSILGMLVLGCAPAEQTEVTTVSGIDNLIRKSVPARASQAQVVVFLDEHHIAHSDFTPASRMIASIVRDTTQSGEVKGSILIKFYFDRKARLKNYSVQEVFGGA